MTNNVFPTKDLFIELAGASNLIPVCREIFADTETPIGVFKKLGEGQYSFLLESVQGGERWGRYSFMGIEPMFVFKSRKNSVVMQTAEGIETMTVDDPLKFLQKYMDAYRPAAVDNLPRFFGGVVGYLGYEMVSFFESVPDTLPDELNLPDAWLMAPGLVLVFDNLKQTIKIVVNVHVTSSDGRDVLYDAAVDRLDKLVAKLRAPIIPMPVSSQTQPCPSFEPNRIRGKLTQDKFESMVTRAKEYILGGDIIQVVLSQGFEASEVSEPFDIYRALRRINPSPYLFYLQFEDVALLGSSPEVMVRVDGRRVTLRPIAGTRPRGETDNEDIRLEKELLADPKERAEHVMLVDLARNDVGRVSEYGSVRLTESMVVEHYSHVMHIVSNVEGTLREGVSSFDVLRASFPAGTVSGAPKVRAMEIIHELETSRRGPYAGAVGYFSFSGNMDLGITIRTIVIKDGIAHMQAGAGIVADSIPAIEYAETRHKAAALFKAIQTVFEHLE